MPPEDGAPNIAAEQAAIDTANAAAAVAPAPEVVAEPPAPKPATPAPKPLEQRQRDNAEAQRRQAEKDAEMARRQSESMEERQVRLEQELKNERRERQLERVARTHNLTDYEMTHIKGDTPEEMAANAQEFIAYRDGLLQNHEAKIVNERVKPLEQKIAEVVGQLPPTPRKVDVPRPQQLATANGQGQKPISQMTIAEMEEAARAYHG